ncbi:MAG: immune inhibitor A [Chloroflexi bacterium]|nr:immune inhibitor A [Chloroflexota bacterium]
MEAAVKQTPPGRDLYSLRARLRPTSDQPIAPAARPGGVSYQEGHSQAFWVADRNAKANVSVNATLRLVTPHAYFYVQDGQNVSTDKLRESGEVFESNIVAAALRFFIREWPVGPDGDPHITILHTRASGPPGWYSSADEYPAAINPFSNERRMIYVNLASGSPGTSSYYATIAHELQHSIQWAADPSEDTWINEGLSEFAVRLTGFGGASSVGSFAAKPDTQLNAWAEDHDNTLPHYGAAYLFLSYFSEHYGGQEALKELLMEKARGMSGVERVINRLGYATTFDDIFAAWVVANFLDNPSLGDGHFGYKDLDIRVKAEPVDSFPIQSSAVVQQYAADYLEVRPPSPDVAIIFTGTNRVKLVPNDPYSGRTQWWSNRGDVMNTNLTRYFDLSGIDEASLSFWTWYDVEKDYDYAYVEVSTDGGASWTILPGRYTTDANPNGNNLGYGYTGKSGGAVPTWVNEQIDLSPFAGQSVLIRFEYVTDDAYNGPGFVVDDISIPEMSYLDDAETDQGWTANGFIRATNALPERFRVQLIKVGPATEVESLPLNDDQTGQWIIRGFGREFERGVLVVSALAPVTTEPASYQYSIEPMR